ncbi:MAG TPA: T9SS type A sorting domain-containing protein, partial [Segetibacter sp.]
INFASFKWTPGDSTTKSIKVAPASNTVYTVMVTDYKKATGSASLLVYPAQGPTVTAPAAVARTNSPSSCAVLVSDADLGAAVAVDNCPGLTVKRTGVPAGNLFPVGVTTITYTAASMSGLTKSATQTVTITDISKPAFTTGLSAPLVIWPPDHRLKDVALTYATADICGAVTNKITVSSTDPITGVSDGDQSPDWKVINDHLVQLRAERGNGREARVYTITVTPIDVYGNTGTPQSTNVTIAHNITGPITGTSFKIGSTVNFSGAFWDKGGNKHTGEWVIDDNTLVKGIVTEPSGTKNGKLTGSYKFTAAGTYKLRMNITDQNNLTSYCNTNEDMEAIVVIYDPAGGYTCGGGWFASPAGALKSDATATGKANFGYAVSYFKGAANPKGETQFELKVGNLEFNALNFEYLSIDGAKAQLKGTGKITGGQSGVNFIMTVVDGALDGTGIDKVRIKIYNKNTGQVFYDNEQGSSDAVNPVTKVGTNSQIIISGRNVSTDITTARIAVVASARQEDVLTAKLQAQAFPNPSNSHFTLSIHGINNEPITIRVIDILGRLVEVQKGISGSRVILGATYLPGLYIAEVLQGKEKVVLKLVKQPK